MTDVLELSSEEKSLYNLHLKVSKTQQNKPFRYRKQFDSVDDKTRIAVKKLASFLKRFSHIKAEEFIVAPYKVYPDETYFSLDFYNTLKATKAYTLYQQQIIHQDIDSSLQLSNILESLKFIQNFCIKKNIQLNSYLLEQSDKLPSFIIHLKEHKINFYVLYGFKNFTKVLKQIDLELLKFILGDETVNQMLLCKNKLFLSKKAYPLIINGLQKVHEKLKKEVDL